jgi:hypothetical protein
VGDQDVGGFDVVVHDAPGVQVCQGFEHVLQPRCGQVRSGRTGIQDVAQVFAFDQFHDQVFGAGVVFSGFCVPSHGGDVLVADPAVDQHFAARGGAGVGGVEELHCCRFAGPGVCCAVHGGFGAAAQDLFQAERAGGVLGRCRRF